MRLAYADADADAVADADADADADVDADADADVHAHADMVLLHFLQQQKTLQCLQTRPTPFRPTTQSDRKD